jgi:hypothetical protein
MMRLDKVTLSFRSPCYYLSSVFVPYVLVFLQLMGVYPCFQYVFVLLGVTDLQGPPSERTQTDKIRDLKSLAQQYAHDRGSCDDTRISYLEMLEDRDNDNLTLARMIAG